MVSEVHADNRAVGYDLREGYESPGTLPPRHTLRKHPSGVQARTDIVDRRANKRPPYAVDFRYNNSAFYNLSQPRVPISQDPIPSP